MEIGKIKNGRNIRLGDIYLGALQNPGFLSIAFLLPR
jgi:hypothetical protein